MGARSRQIANRSFTAEAMVGGMVRLYDQLFEAKGL
jgi:hypothetical protein